MARDPKETKPKKPGREAAETKQRQLLERRRNRGNSEPADWGACDAGLLLSVVASVTKSGCAIQFGYTLDGGAYRIRIVGGGEANDEYIRPTEDIDVYLRALCADFGGDY